MDYANGKIYMLEPICEYPEGDVYYGNTTTTLVKRLYHHTVKSNKCSSKILFDKYGKDNIKIVLICEYPCKNKSELKAMEGKYQRENKCVNRRVAGRTVKEWGSSENYKVYQKNHYEEDKQKHIDLVLTRRKENKTAYNEYQKEYQRKVREKQRVAKATPLLTN